MKLLMCKCLVVITLLLFGAVNSVQAQSTASYSVTVTSLSTASAGAVTGTSFAIPSSYSVMISWQVVADGSALSVNLEGSFDNSSWFTVDTQTTAAGGLKNFGFSSIRFARISQVSRTGGTLTTGTFVTSRGFITSSGSGNLNSLGLNGNLSMTSGQILAADGTAGAPGYSWLSATTTGIFKSGSTFSFSFSGTEAQVFGVNTLWLKPNASLIQFGLAADAAITRLAAGQVTAGSATTQGVISTVLTTNTTSTCTIADTNLTDLWTYTLPAGALNLDGRGLRITVYFTTAANANVKTGQVVFGGTTLAIQGPAANNAFVYKFSTDIIRTSSTAQLAYTNYLVGPVGGGGTTIFNPTTPAETMANAIVIKAQGQNGFAAANDICFKMAIVETLR